jgi:hypothetical protein
MTEKEVILIKRQYDGYLLMKTFWDFYTGVLFFLLNLYIELLLCYSSISYERFFFMKEHSKKNFFGFFQEKKGISTDFFLTKARNSAF